MELLVILVLLASAPGLAGAIFVCFVGYSLGKSMRRRSIDWEESAQNNLRLAAVGLAVLSFILLAIFAPDSVGAVVLVSIAYAMGGRAVDKEYEEDI